MDRHPPLSQRRHPLRKYSLPALLLLLVTLAACGDRTEGDAEVPVGTDTGQRAPGLSGTLDDGSDFALEARPGAPTVVLFYRGSSCGLCRLRLQRLAENLPAYERAGSDVVAVTLDPPDAGRALKEAAELAFPVVSVDSATFAIRCRSPATASATFERWATLEAGAAPLPATFVIDEAGIIRFRHVGRNAGDRVSDASIVTLLESLGQ